MPGASFLDTNILVYFAVQDSAHFGRAAEIVEAGGTISVQVLNEFANVARSKMHMEWGEISEVEDLLCSLLQVHPLTVETHRLALGLAEHHAFHVYDATILASALEADCTTLYSEDMQHGQLIAGRLRIVNPFAS
ncbi:MAG: VapC toxin family PIN domain ribonuclease [Devosia sp. 66-14]|nr:PIN domain-containing protein [Devosia sp.]ODS85608.1 MAG: pilus assembly protein [Devosia sp. SCN 66-27]OJX24678.1 MAG: VapC toxin family PIN domain ribonuclease [Devosia sp. 66-14]